MGGGVHKKKEESDLLTKKTVLSKEEYTKKSDSLRKKVIDYQSQRRSSLDKIATQRTKYRETLINETDNFNLEKGPIDPFFHIKKGCILIEINIVLLESEELCFYQK